MVYVPTPPPPSRRSKELAAAIVHLIDEYQAREGSLKPMEINVALQLARRGALAKAGGGIDRRTRVLILAAAIGLLATLGVLVSLFGSR